MLHNTVGVRRYRRSGLGWVEDKGVGASDSSEEGKASEEHWDLKGRWRSGKGGGGGAAGMMCATRCVPRSNGCDEMCGRNQDNENKIRIRATAHLSISQYCWQHGNIS